MVSAPAVRLAAWIKHLGLTQEAAAERLGSRQSTISHVLLGRRLPGRALSNAIARETAEWEDGPIESFEWDDATRAAS